MYVCGFNFGEETTYSLTQSFTAYSFVHGFKYNSIVMVEMFIIYTSKYWPITTENKMYAEQLQEMEWTE